MLVEEEERVVADLAELDEEIGSGETTGERDGGQGRGGRGGSTGGVLKEMIEADLDCRERAGDEAFFFLGEGGKDLALGPAEEEGAEDTVELRENQLFVFLGEDDSASFLVPLSSSSSSSSSSSFIPSSDGILHVAAVAAIAALSPTSIEGLIEPLLQAGRLRTKKFGLDKPQKGKQFLQVVL